MAIGSAFDGFTLTTHSRGTKTYKLLHKALQKLAKLKQMRMAKLVRSGTARDCVNVEHYQRRQTAPARPNRHVSNGRPIITHTAAP